MPAGSTVSLVWGVQVDTIPLLLASQCYPSYHQAEIFFALLSLRLRTSTLRLELATASPGAMSVASLPIEVREMILDELFGTLYLEARTVMVNLVFRCPCSRELMNQLGGAAVGDRPHECGIDCPFILKCCRPSSDSSERKERERGHRCRSCDGLSSILWAATRRVGGEGSQVVDALANLGLELIHLPSYVEDVVPPSIVGLLPFAPFPESPRNLHNMEKQIPQPRHSLVMPDPNGIDVEHQVTVLPPHTPLSEKQRRAFRRFLKVLRLGQQSLASQQLARRPSAQDGKDSGSRDATTEHGQPSLLLVHTSWADY